MARSGSSTLLTSLDTALRDSVVGTQTDVRLCSPYIGADICKWLRDAHADSSAAWQLLTKLDPVAAAYGSLHLPGLRKLSTPVWSCASWTGCTPRSF